MLGWFRRPIGPDDKYEDKVVRGLDKITIDCMAIINPTLGIFNIIMAVYYLDFSVNKSILYTSITICFALLYTVIVLRNDRPVWGGIGAFFNLIALIVFILKFFDLI
ncbi:MAG: hypothetical protein P9X22_07750 [Candidatus Zapsychrus exili]|nr:hypothetical protein [Candidatus Zapsychrus exili]